MIALKIQTSFTATNYPFFHTGRRLSNTKNSFLCLCKPNDSSSEASSPEGDTRKQDLLARIAMLQAQKVRLADYLDERSAYLTQFGEEANAEFDKVGEEALKGLDEASARIMENIESRMQAFEESAELNRLEIGENENKLAEFEGQMEKDRNEWLFFKNLRKRTPTEQAKAKDEMEKIKDLANENAGSKTRRNIYLAFIGLTVIGLADSFLSSSSDWRKVAALGAILVALLSQFISSIWLSTSKYFPSWILAETICKQQVDLLWRSQINQQAKSQSFLPDFSTAQYIVSNFMSTFDAEQAYKIRPIGKGN